GRVLRLDPKTYLPRSITLFDTPMHVTAAATLDNPVRVETRGLPPGAWPWLSTFISAKLGDGRGTLELRFEEKQMSDGYNGDDDLIRKDIIFNFEKLLRMYKPA